MEKEEQKTRPQDDGQTQETQIEKSIKAFELKQLPIIVEQLKTIGDGIDKEIALLNLENQVCTEDTVQNLKSLKAKMNKDFAKFEEERKMVKNAIIEPYKYFEELYVINISNKYKDAEEILKQKIIDYELKIKQAKQNVLMQYFNELKTLYKIDWIIWEQLGFEVKLSISEKQYKKEIMDRFKEINEALEMIKKHEYAAEIIVEYRKSLNSNTAISIIINRKEAEKIEAERILQQRTQNRLQKLFNKGFIISDNGCTFKDLFISINDIQTLDNDEWNKRYIEFENAIFESQQSETKNVVSAPTQVQILAAAPQPEEPIMTACIEVKATMPVIKMLSAYLKENGIEYRNIKEYKKD